MKTCCNKFKWEHIQDAQKARGCEFTYGKCANCGGHLIHMFYTSIVHEGTYAIVSQQFVTEMLNKEGPELKAYMQDWYDNRESESN